MGKKTNFFYGVTVDGLLLKVAELECSRDRIIIHRLETLKLNSPLFVDNEVSLSNMGDEDNIRELSFDNASDDYDLRDIDIFSNSANLDKLNEGIPEPQPKQGETKSTSFGKMTSQSDSANKFLGKFALNEGKISLSCLESQVEWKVVKANKKLSIQEIRKLALTPDRVKDPSCHIDFTQTGAAIYNVGIHQGSFDLMTFLTNSSRLIYNSKAPLAYRSIEPFSISLLNIFNLFYSHLASSYTTLLYLGDESKYGLVIKDRIIQKLFPLMIYDTEPERVREAVFAKLMLENESSDFPITDNIVLAGDFATEADIAFYNRRMSKQHQLFRLDSSALKKYKHSLVINNSIYPDVIPSFAIPIALSIKAILGHVGDLQHFNFLPKKVSDSQNIFKMGGVGYFLLFMIIATGLIGTNLYQQKTSYSKELQRKHHLAEQELNILKAFYNLITGYQQKEKAANEANARSGRIAAPKNSWSNVLYKLSDFTTKNPLLWVDNISTQDTRFILKGSSYYRDRITNLSMLFDKGVISRIAERKIADHTIWDFEISFERPAGDAPVDIPIPEYFNSYEAYAQYVIKERERERLEALQLANRQNNQTIGNFVTSSKLDDASQDASQLYQKAKETYVNNNFNEAIAFLNTYISTYPNGKEIGLAYYLLGELYYVLGQYNQAVPNFNHVYRLKGEKVTESLFFMAKSYEEMSDYGNAINYFNILLREYPNTPLSRAASEQVLILREGR